MLLRQSGAAQAAPSEQGPPPRPLTVVGTARLSERGGSSLRWKFLLWPEAGILACIPAPCHRASPPSRVHFVHKEPQISFLAGVLCAAGALARLETGFFQY